MNGARPTKFDGEDRIAYRSELDPSSELQSPRQSTANSTRKIGGYKTVIAATTKRWPLDAMKTASPLWEQTKCKAKYVAPAAALPHRDSEKASKLSSRNQIEKDSSGRKPEGESISPCYGTRRRMMCGSTRSGPRFTDERALATLSQRPGVVTCGKDKPETAVRESVPSSSDDAPPKIWTQPGSRACLARCGCGGRQFGSRSLRRRGSRCCPRAVAEAGLIWTTKL